MLSQKIICDSYEQGELPDKIDYLFGFLINFSLLLVKPFANSFCLKGITKQNRTIEKGVNLAKQSIKSLLFISIVYNKREK